MKNRRQATEGPFNKHGSRPPWKPTSFPSINTCNATHLHPKSHNTHTHGRGSRAVVCDVLRGNGLCMFHLTRERPRSCLLRYGLTGVICYRTNVSREGQSEGGKLSKCILTLSITLTPFVGCGCVRARVCVCVCVCACVPDKHQCINVEISHKIRCS